MLYTAYQYPGPAAVRYPRGTGPGSTIEQDMKALNIGEAVYCRHGQQVAILAFGAMLQPAMQAALSHNASVINMRFIKPLDEKMIEEVGM